MIETEFGSPGGLKKHFWLAFPVPQPQRQPKLNLTVKPSILYILLKLKMGNYMWAEGPMVVLVM